MDSTYLKKWGLAFSLSALVPVGYYFYLLTSNISESNIETKYQHQTVNGPIQPLPYITAIDQNWKALGKALFHSPLLSKDNTISCSSCHVVDYGGDDGLPLSKGVDNLVSSRNSPTVLNAVFNFRQFWDGREPNLSHQVSGPLHDPAEMATNWPDVIEKLSKNEYFSQAFHDISPSGITEKNIIKAIVTYEESLITPGAPIDQFLLGDKNALTPQQISGYNKFLSFGCATCHQGQNIGGNLFQKLGRIASIPEQLALDLGKFTSTGEDEDKYVFKVPSLRNITQTAPYFHNGSIKTLEEAVVIMAESQLGLTPTQEDIADIIALFQAFSAPVQVEVKND